MPAGSHAIHGFKAYTAASRHERTTWMVVDEASERRHLASRSMIGQRPDIREQDVWRNIGENLSRQPQKASALDMLHRMAETPPQGSRPDSSATSDEASGRVERRAFRLSLAGLLTTMALASLDQNIVSTALPRIVGELGGLAHLPWVITAFMLTATATAPVYGKLSDMHGRRPLFVVAITVFIAGSALCGLARSMTGLILFRGLQGLGAGGLMVLAQTAIADLVPPRQRGRYQGLFSGVFALCSVTGPVLGGVITDALSWRWIFYVNLPVGMVALSLILIGLPRTERPRVVHRIDYPGAVLLTLMTAALLLLLSWGGTVAAWSSPTIVGLGLGAAALFVLLLARERVAAEPILPLPLFRNRVFAVAITVVAITATALFGAFVFLPTFFQLVQGKSPSDAGLLTAPLMAGLIVASVIGGRLVSALGRYKRLSMLGLGLAVAGLAAIATAARAAAPLPAIEAALVVTGAGLGLVMPNLTVAIQNAVPPGMLGVATSAVTFFRSLGGAFGVALSGSLLTSRVDASLAAAGSVADAARRAVAGGAGGIAAMPPELHSLVAAAYRQAIGTTFATGAVIAGFGLVLLLLLPERPLRDMPAG
jgi:EmrB/QacA subfamily drug resistance transporter